MTLDTLAAALIALGVFAGLPDRYGPVDAGALVAIAAFLASGVGLVVDAPWGRKVARIGSMVVLGLGLLLVMLLSISISYLFGIYGAVGRGGAIVMILVMALVVPYLMVFPIAQIVWSRR